MLLNFFILRNITLSNYLRANNNDDIACVVFELEYVMSTSSRKDYRSSISLQSEKNRFHTFTSVLRLVTYLILYLSLFCLAYFFFFAKAFRTDFAFLLLFYKI